MTLNPSSDESGDPINMEFYKSLGRIVVKEGIENPIDLTPSNIEITNLIFRKINTGSSNAVKVELELRQTVGDILKQERTINEMARFLQKALHLSPSK